MVTFADAFVRLRVDGQQLRSDTVKALKSGDVKAAGEAAGKTWVQGMGGQIVHVSGVITKALAGSAVIVGAASIKMATGFQAGITSLSTGAAVAQKNLGLIANGIKSVAVATGTTTEQLIKGEYMIASAGYSGADGLTVLKAAAQGAKVGTADLGVTADAVTTVLKDYNLKGSAAATVTSELISTVAHGKTHLQDLASSLARVLPTAAALHISFAEIGGAMAAMTAKGTSAHLAAMGLNSTILSLAAPTKQASSLMNLLGLSSQQAAKYQADLAAGNTKAAKAILATASTSTQLSSVLTKHGLIAALQQVNDLALKAGPRGSSAYTAALKAMLGGTQGLRVALQLTSSKMHDMISTTAALAKISRSGTHDVQGWGQVQQDTATKLAKLRAAAEVAGIDIGQKLLPVVTGLLDFTTAHSGSILIFAGSLAALAVTITIVSKAYAAYKAIVVAVTAIQKLCTAAALGTRLGLIGLQIAQVATAVAARVAAAAQWLWNIAMDANPIGIVIAAITALVGGVIYAYTHFSWFRNLVQAIWGWIKQNWPYLLAILIGPIGLAIGWIIKHWSEVKSAFDGFVRFTRRMFADFVGFLLGIFGTILHGAADAFGWIPGIGPKLRQASSQFAQFRDSVNAAILGIQGHTVNVGVDFFPTSSAVPGPVRGRASGGLITGPGGPRADRAGIFALSNFEYVQPADTVAHYGVPFMDALRNKTIPRMASGGLVTNTRLPGAGVMQAAVMPPVKRLASILSSSPGFNALLGGMIAEYALTWLGAPYKWGGTGPAGWDCSGFTDYVYRKFGWTGIPRTAAAQKMWASPSATPTMGGLAFFAGADGTAKSPGHVGIVLGANSMVNAFGTGFGTIISSIFGSSGSVSGFGVPPGNRFSRGGVLREPIVGLGLRTGGRYMLGEHGSEVVTSERGLAQLAALLAELIAAVDQVGEDAGHAVAVALGGSASAAAYRREYSPR